jgi:DNA-binding NtrC family response regulator
MAAILIVHDEAYVRHGLGEQLRRAGQTVVEAVDMSQLSTCTSSDAEYDVVVVAARRNTDGVSMARLARSKWPMAGIVIAGNRAHYGAEDPTPLTGTDYVASSDPVTLATAVEAACSRRHWTDDDHRGMIELDDEPIIIDPATRAVFGHADRAATVNSTVLITGESGTGKEVLARRIHSNSSRRRYKFVPVNCGGIPETLIETELFGYRKGAFTGAATNTKGLIEEAEYGVLFLDEIGDMPLTMQVHLLRFLDRGEVRAVGGSAIRHVNVRVIAATNRRLEHEIERGRFREDLFFRLSVLSLHLPPLRERRADIAALVHHHVRRAASRLGLPLPQVTPEAMSLLMRYRWPGNIRQLQNVLEQSLVQASGDLITPVDLPLLLRTPDVPFDAHRPINGDEERSRLINTLERHHGNHTEAATALGISRTTLWRRLRQLKTMADLSSTTVKN